MIDENKRKLLKKVRKISSNIKPNPLSFEDNEIEKMVKLLDKKAKEYISREEASKKIQELIKNHTLSKNKLLIGLIFPMADEEIMEKVHGLLHQCFKYRKVSIKDFHTDSITISDIIDDEKPEKLIIIKAIKTEHKTSSKISIRPYIRKTSGYDSVLFSESFLGTDDPDSLITAALVLSGHKPVEIKIIEAIYDNDIFLFQQLKKICGDED